MAIFSPDSYERITCTRPAGSTKSGAQKGAASVTPRERTGQKDPSSIPGQFGAHLETLLKRKRLSVPEFSAELAKHGLNKSEKAIWNYLRGESTPPMPDLPAMATALGLAHWQDMIPPRVR